MSEPGSRRGRVHDAMRAREVILDAAEKVFTKHGFDGARIDAIAKEAGYNKSLIFQYFGDKVGLYVEVMKRADREMSELQLHLLTPLLQDVAVVTDVDKFRVLVETIVGAFFDYLAEHPRLIRMLLWEQAEDWQTYKKIFSEFQTDDTEQFEMIFRAAYQAGLLRSNFPPMTQMTLVMQICMSYLTWVPIYQLTVPDADFMSAEAHQRARRYLIDFIVAGLMIDPPDKAGTT